MGLLSSLLRDIDYRHRLFVLEEKSPTADQQNKTECCRSGICCWRRPCDLAPADVQPLAKFLKTTPKKLFREYLVVDSYQNKLRLRPRRVQQMGGHFLSQKESWDIETPCIFLDTKNQNACKVHEAKPRGGREFKCWDERTYDDKPYLVWKLEDLKKLGWSGDRYEAEVGDG